MDAAGIDPESVTDILPPNMHMDHVGGLLDGDDHPPAVPVLRPGGDSRQQRLPLGPDLLGVLIACWGRAEREDRMRSNI